MSYGDYPSALLGTGPSTRLRTGSEQLMHLLFLKMADEWSPMGEPVVT